MTREECIQKIRHIQRSMYTFVWEDRKIHQFKADDADKFYYYLDMIAKYLIEDLPQEQESKTGHWITLKDEYGDIHEAVCSRCDSNGNHKWKYCPSCGAKMSEIPTSSESEEEE